MELKTHSLLNSRDGVPGAEPPRHVDQSEVRDDGVAVLQEYILRLEILFGWINDAYFTSIPGL